MIRFAPYVFKRLWRQPARTALTVLGVAVAVYLYAAVEATQDGVGRATTRAAEDAVLVVYRENRYCPFTSRLPQHYQSRIARIPGVKSVVPMKVTVSNCRASLDVVTFRGVPRSEAERVVVPRFELVAGSFEEWQRRSDAALVGETLALRRGIRVGDRFSAAGVTVYVAAIGRTTDPQSRNAAYTHLPFLQEASRRGGTGGIVTQFNVEVDDPQRLDAVAEAIDLEFSRESEPTHTQAEKSFTRAAAHDVVVAVGFARWLGWGALVAVFALVANALTLIVQERVRELAVLETIGYRREIIAGLILAEGALVGLLGGALGSLGATVTLALSNLSLSMEGIHLEIAPDPAMVLTGIVAAVVLSVLAGVIPAVQVARQDLTDALRSV